MLKYDNYLIIFYFLHRTYYHETSNSEGEIMNSASNIETPLQSIFWQRQHSLIKQILLVLGGALLLAFASQLSIPLKPVPLTFQSATVVLIGMAYGPRYGTYAILTYLMMGACGLPVLADFSFGISKFFGPTAGYLIGFIPAAWMSGYLAQKGWARNAFTSFIAACVGVSIIFTLGVTVLSQFVGFHAAIELGVMPFMLSESIKLIAVSVLIPTLWKKRS